MATLIRWQRLCRALEIIEGLCVVVREPVSYTHLDVYKRQEWYDANLVDGASYNSDNYLNKPYHGIAGVGNGQAVSYTHLGEGEIGIGQGVLLLDVLA